MDEDVKKVEEFVAQAEQPSFAPGAAITPDTILALIAMAKMLLDLWRHRNP